MATGSGTLYGEYSKGSRLKLVYSYSQSTSGNYTKFALALYGQKTADTGTHTSNYNNSTYTLTGLDEEQLINGTGNYTWKENEEILIGESTYIHYHNTDGSVDDVTLKGTWYTNLTSSSIVGTNLSVSGTIKDIPTIPRYATLSHSLNSKTINTIKINWSADSTCDRVQYKIGSGSWVTASTSSAKSGIYTISGLNPATKYSIYTRVRRKDSQLYTTSSVLSITTYDIAKISNASNFNLGSNASVTITNPASATAILVVKVGTTQILSKQLSTGANTISFTDAELDAIYKEFATNNSVTISYTLTTNNNSSWTNSKTVICTLTGNQKTGYTNVDGEWKRTKRWINVNGEWKQCVRWVNVDGNWKRCI